MKLFRLTYKTIMVAACLALSLNSLAQENPLITIDRFLRGLGNNPSSIDTFFASDVLITNVQYSDDGDPIATQLKAAELAADIEKLKKNYDCLFSALVITVQEYGSSAKLKCSVFGRFANAEDTIITRSLQVFHIVEFNGMWKISSLTIQQEHPTIAIPVQFWPPELTQELDRTVINSSKMEVSEYDPSKIYNADETDLEAEYPGGEDVLKLLLNSFDASLTSSDNNTPFTIVINEDGYAELKYINDLSGAQIEKAKSLVNSMLLWYPAEKNKASVKQKIVLYIQ